MGCLSYGQTASVFIKCYSTLCRTPVSSPIADRLRCVHGIQHSLPMRSSYRYRMLALASRQKIRLWYLKHSSKLKQAYGKVVAPGWECPSQRVLPRRMAETF